MIIILTGKTASGKDTIAASLLEKYPNLIKVITTTTRRPRNAEKQGVDYNFITAEKFKRKIELGDFIEFVEYGGSYYGTEKSQIDQPGDLLWRIDPSRAGKIRQLINADLVVIYITAPDQEIIRRLKNRNMPQPEIDRRMRQDRDFWLKYQDKYDFVVENPQGKLTETIKAITQILEASMGKQLHKEQVPS